MQQLGNITSLPEEHDVPTEPGLGNDRFACRTLGSVARDQQQGIRTLAHDGWHRLQHLAVPFDSMHATDQQQDASLRRDSQGPVQSLPCSCRHVREALQFDPIVNHADTSRVHAVGPHCDRDGCAGHADRHVGGPGERSLQMTDHAPGNDQVV